jgi:hypothetical protein
MEVELATKILEDWDDCCKSLEIPHFLIYGTCLGFFRDGEFIEGDSDIDTRVICKKGKWKEFVKAMKAEGFTKGEKDWQFYRDGILLCIERSVKVGEIIQDGKKYKVMPYYHKFDEIWYNGRKYNLPHPVVKYLEGRYGKDWYTPNPKWDKYKDAKGA